MTITMQKQIWALLALMTIGSMLYAQPGKRGHHPPREDARHQERVEALKIGFITRELSLSPEESQKFWPVYNEMRTKEDELKKNFRPEKAVAEMSEQEVAAHFERKLALIDAEAALQRQYLHKLREALPLRKVLMLPAAEREFKRKLMNEMRQRRNGKKGG